jgi:hypothetical protein
MTDEEYREKAREQYGKDGEIEIDDDADVSRDERPEVNVPGAYVQAWVWIAS